MGELEPDPILEAAREALRVHVCASCLDARDDGTCGLTRRECALERHLPLVVAAVTSVDSDRMEDYVDAVRARVCANCEHQDEAGECALRESGDCALETYLPFVVNALEGLRR